MLFLSQAFNYAPTVFVDPSGLTAVEEVTKGAYIYVKYPGDKMHGPHVHVLARRGGALLGRVTPDGARVLTGSVPKTALKKLAGGAIFSAVLIALEPTALGDSEMPGYWDRQFAWSGHAFDVYRQMHGYPEDWGTKPGDLTPAIVEARANWIQNWLKNNPTPADYNPYKDNPCPEK